MQLPDELFDEILTRVPVKYLLRCRCVSKQWCSVIDTTKFVEKYLKLSIESNRGGLVIQGDDDFDDDDEKCLLADLETFDNGNAVIDVSEEVGGIVKGARVIGSANGLVCLVSMSEDGMDSVFLLNPCTRKCKKLPVVGKEFLGNDNLRYFRGGFGYDHVSDDFKVVMTARCNSPTNGIMAVVYSLRRNTWTPVADVFGTENIAFFDIWGFFENGVLRWMAIDVVSLQTIIVGFDLGLERFIEAQCCNRNVRLGDISIDKAWGEEMSANPVFRSFRSPRLLMYSKSLEKILLEVERKKFMWYDFRSKAFENVTIPGIPNLFVSHRYIESLFPLIEDRQPSH